jgi:hypothetical protein
MLERFDLFYPDPVSLRSPAPPIGDADGTWGYWPPGMPLREA